MPNTTKLIFESVKSTQLKEIAHDGAQTLYVRFKSKKVYSYSPVSPEQFQEFKSSDSLGRYFHQNFKMNSQLSIKPV